MNNSSRYLLQCMKLLQSNEPEKMSSALPNLNELILKASKLELLDNLPELPKLLLSLQDNFDLENFDQNLSNAIVSLILRIPTPTIQILATGFYEKETNLYSQTRILRAFMAIVLMYVHNEENPNNLNTIHHLSRYFGESLLKPLKDSAAIYDKIFRSTIFIPIAQMLIKDLCIFARLSGDRSLLLETCTFILSFNDHLTFKEELRVGMKWLVEGFQAKQIMSPEFMELVEFGKILYNFEIHSV